MGASCKEALFDRRLIACLPFFESRIIECRMSKKERCESDERMNEKAIFQIVVPVSKKA
jgi:hypothetical protein